MTTTTTTTYHPADTRLFQPLKVGHMMLQNRIFLPPLTRFRNGYEHEALPVMERYYSDRASTPGTLLVSEATGVSPSEEGSAHLPGLGSAAQAAAWKRVVDGVHARGSFFFQQLWGTGRGADAAYMAQRGFTYHSSSAVAMAGSESVTPVAMTEAEILQFIDDFAAAAKRAVEDAGADGVEIHGAHGYLIDQFLSDHVNQRTDRWGGSVENRARLLFEVVRAVVAALGGDAARVAVRLSPFAGFQDAEKTDIIGTYTYVIEQLKAMHLPFAYLSLVEAAGDPKNTVLGQTAANLGRTLDFALDLWDHTSPVLVAGGYRPESAAWAVEEHYRKWDVVVGFGRFFISNPDLVFRVQHDIPFTPYNRATFYIPMADEGYNDYPFSEEYLRAHPEDKVKSA